MLQYGWLSLHCVKNVQMRSFFWSVCSRIRTGYGDLLHKSPYSARIRENADRKKLVFRQFSRSANDPILSLAIRLPVVAFRFNSEAVVRRCSENPEKLLMVIVNTFTFQKVFQKKSVLKNFAKFTENYQCLSLQATASELLLYLGTTKSCQH